jgi:hypothetical protein
MSILQGLDSPVQVSLTDLTIRDTLPSHPSPVFQQVGAGILCYFGCAGTLRRVALHNNHFAGILLHGEQTRLRIEDLTLSDSPPVTLSPLRRRGGVGALVTDRATLLLERFSIRHHDTSAFLLRGEVCTHLTHGDISQTPTGVDTLQLLISTEEAILDHNVDWDVDNLTSFHPHVETSYLDTFFTVINTFNTSNNEP